MEIKTKFAPGDKAWVIKDCKLTKIQINAVVIRESGVYFAESVYCCLYPDETCFATKDELLAYITENSEE